MVAFRSQTFSRQHRSGCRKTVHFERTQGGMDGIIRTHRTEASETFEFDASCDESLAQRILDEFHRVVNVVGHGSLQLCRESAC